MAAPMLTYERGVEALEWLVRTFGFVERTRMVDASGRLAHGGVHVYVDDVAAHLERARAAGTTILGEIEHGGPGSRYRVEDIEGHRWMFMARRR